jgi:hypothetical protein
MYNSTVSVHDWDGDGDGDLLIGRGRPRLVLNEGTRQQPAFGDAVVLRLNGQRVTTNRTQPCLADWDCDGRDDVLIGRDGNIVWYRNTGQPGQPVFDQPPRILLSADNWGPRENNGADDQRTRPSRHIYAICVADFNSDGHPDLLLGDHYFITRTLTREQRARYREVSKLRSALWSEYRELIRTPPEDMSRQERIERFREALRKEQQISGMLFAGPQAAQPRMERHGGVWLYERIAD